MRTRKFSTRMLLGSFAVMLFVTSCAGPPAQASEARSNLDRDSSPDVSVGKLDELVTGNQDFAFDLYQVLSKKDGNLFFSPYSISLALAMTYAGAMGETEREMAETLHFTLSQESLHEALNALDILLESRSEGVGDEDVGFRLNIANAIWGQEGYEFLSEFLDILAQNYGAGLRLLDYAGDPEGSRTTINDWVSDQTEGKIEDLIPPGVIDATTRLVLANAIYFKANWMHQFEERDTMDGQFTLPDGSIVQVPMMSQGETFRYTAGSGFQANALHFIRDDQKRSALNQLVKHLKPGGRAIIIEYNARRGNFAVPHPLDEEGFVEVAFEVGLVDVHIAARVASSFMGEMYAGVGIAPTP